jgi:hypothetical protein
MSGIDQLSESLTQVLTKLEGIERKLNVADMTAPLTAEALCERWQIEAETESLQLLYLGRKCRAWGLRQLKGGRGWNALYGRADVLHAESYAGGKINRRKHAV